ncbi:MAG: alpha/beta hydrolase [Rhodospirillales bacterium 70-18]|nr:MAG: alpha/beta hydrolase [Rhodospirillales bacterium 70-18]
MRLRAVEMGAAEMGAGAVRPLVLLHGLFGSAANFGAVQKRLAARGRTIALDLRNHGGSPHAAAMDYAAMAADVLETLDALGALPAMLVGHSMGGKVAMAAALEAPAQVARLVVADIAPVAYPPRLRGYVAAMAAIPLHPGLTRAQADTALAGAVAEPGVRGFLLQNLRLGPQPAWRIGLAEIARAMPVIEGWETPAGASYPGPALFVAGGRSDYILPEHRPAIRALFPAARFVTLKQAGHWLHADDPDGFLTVLEAMRAA